MKTVIIIALLSISFQANASIGDWLEKVANKAVGLDASIITISNLEYSNGGFDVVTFDSDSTSSRVKGRVLNTSNSKTIKTIVFKYEILECNNAGQDCTTIDEDENRWDTNIPPKQVRYFDHLIRYTPGDASKHIYFRQNVKYVYPYGDM